MTKPLITKANILSIGWLAKPANNHVTWVESFLPKMIERAIAVALSTHIEVENKQKELIEAYN